MKFKLKGSDFADFIARSACVEKNLFFLFGYQYPLVSKFRDRYFFGLERTNLFRLRNYISLADLGFFELTFKDCPIRDAYFWYSDFEAHEDYTFTPQDHPDKFPKSLSGSFVLTRKGADLSSICPTLCSDSEILTYFGLHFLSGRAFLEVSVGSIYSPYKERDPDCFRDCNYYFRCEDFTVTFDEDFYYGFLKRVLNCDLRRIESILMDVKTILGG